MTFPDVVFVDANVPMYAAGREHPYRSPCLALLHEIARNRIVGVTNTEVHQEILHRFVSQRLPAEAIRISELLEISVPTTLPVTLAEVSLARRLAIPHPGLRARDLIHLAVMRNHGIRAILTSDRHFDSVPELTRLDPLALST